jgi:hypothetical protein
MKTKGRFLWSRSVLVGALLVCAVCGSGQTPGSGRTEGGVFKNSYFHLSYRYPSILHPVDVNTMELPKSGLNNEFMMFAAQQGAENYGLMFLAEKMGVGEYPLTGSLDFLKRVQPSWARRDDKPVNWGHIGSASGLIFDTLRFRTPQGDFDCYAAAVVGNYILVLRFNAKSPIDLNAMLDSIRSIAKIN